MVNSSNKSCIQFSNNIANIFGNSLYQAVPSLCNISCINDKVVGISNDHIATPPNLLKLRDPAICIDNDKDTQCNSYFVQNIMLGGKIVIPACVLNYYNQPVASILFLVQSGNHPDFYIAGPNQVLISCDTFEGTEIVAHQTLLKLSTNFSISITLNTALYSNWKQISVNLTIELSPCLLGFWQYSKYEKCKCYNPKDDNEFKNIVFCSDSSSTIRGGYWFGSVTVNLL